MTEDGKLKEKLQKLSIKALEAVSDNEEDKYYQYVDQMLGILPHEHFTHLNFMFLESLYNTAYTLSEKKQGRKKHD